MAREPQSLDVRIRSLWIGLFLVAISVCTRPFWCPTPAEIARRNIIHLLDDRHASALTLAEEYLRQYPRDPSGIALAAQAASDQSRHELAIRRWQQLPRDGGLWEFLSEYGQGRRRDVQGRISEAEQHYRAAVHLNPLHIDANDRLGHLLQVSGRVWEAGPHFFVELLQGKCRGDELLGMSTSDRFFRRDDRLEQLGIDRVPPDPLIQLALARLHIQQNETAEAEELLKAVIAVHPEFGEAQGRWGRIVLDRGDPQEFRLWRQQLPEAARHHPEVWLVLGLHARGSGDIPGATRCFLEALKLSPNHLGSNIQVAACLEQLQRSDLAKRFADRGQVIGALDLTINLMRSDPSERLMISAAQDLVRLGRYWEAIGWCYVMRWVPMPQEFPTSHFRLWSPDAVREPALNASARLPASYLSLADYPLPNWPAASEAAAPPDAPLASRAAWNLVDTAPQVGIDFEYYEGTTEATRMNHIFSTVGGGLGAIDFDRDGWPDLHLAQAHDWRNPAPQTYADRLYRNTGAGRFVDVTHRAGVAETGFSHGVTVADYDQDGFPDLYINNKGQNRLYHNQGDGTFADVTAPSGTAGGTEDWSTSSVFADFNGDHAPDLYVLNYSLVTPTAEKICTGPSGQPVACTPEVLPACRDRLFLSGGEGTFRDVTDASGLTDPNGRGLGVIAWHYGDDRRLGLFIGNDTTENYLFVNRGNNAEGIPQFQEEGIVRGVAFDLDGNAQASMGVAAGDANGDGELELFITNFFNESNTLYSRTPQGFFRDLTRPFHLRDASFKMLGFGCQFADLNGDGWADLIATNGHVDQVSSDQTMDRMPPQVFENQGGRRFEEVPESQLGPFFAGRYLGRGMALLDWNRDGRSDIGISHLHSPLALLTPQRGVDPVAFRPLVIRLIGTRGCRDATGATVEMRGSSRSSYSLQTSGSGFLASNEAIHHFFVPIDEDAVQVSVVWPDGIRETWANLLPGAETLLIEGDQRPLNVLDIP